MVIQISDMQTQTNTTKKERKKERESNQHNVCKLTICEESLI